MGPKAKAFTVEFQTSHAKILASQRIFGQWDNFKVSEAFLFFILAAIALI